MQKYFLIIHFQKSESVGFKTSNRVVFLYVMFGRILPEGTIGYQFQGGPRHAVDVYNTQPFNYKGTVDNMIKVILWCLSSVTM